MNNLISLILAIFFLTNCGRKALPPPETPDSYPRIYPTPSLESSNTQTSDELRQSNVSSYSSASDEYKVNPKNFVIDRPGTYSDLNANKEKTSAYIASDSSLPRRSVSEPNSAQMLSEQLDDRNALYRAVVPGAPRVGKMGDFPVGGKAL